MATDRTSLPHVRGLDGIRGLALIAILLYHSNHLIGGFISVDMFFALSGFLITSLLLAEWRKAGRVSLSAFWARRARRLLPALGFLLVGIAVYAAVFAAPTELSRIRGDSIATILYVANWHAVFTHESYFELFATPSPLRHAWTLAVEEQFYLLWPMAFALIITWRKRATPMAVLATAVVGALASGLLMALLFNAADPNRAYYGTDTRAYAVFAGIGAAAAVAQWGHARRRSSRVGLEIGAVVAIAFIVFVWNHFEAQSPGMYYGGFFAIGLAMVVLLLAVANPVRGPINWLLSFKGFVLLGTISYGVYLWHWPINLVLDTDRTGLDDWPLFALRTAVAIAFGTLSYVLIEQPIRHGAGSARIWKVATPVVAIGVVATLVAVTAGAVAAPTAEGLDPTDALKSNTVAAMQGRNAYVNRLVPATTPRVLVAGDSVSLTLGLGAPLTPTTPVAVTSVSMLGCGIAGGIPLGLLRFSPASVCGQWPSIWQRGIDVFRPRAVVLLTGAWDVQDRLINGKTLPSGSPALRRHLEAQLGVGEQIAARAGIPLVLLTTPCFPGGGGENSEQFAQLIDSSHIAWFDAIERDFAAAHPATVRTVDLASYLCPNGHPIDKIGGVPLYADGIHFTPAGAAKVWPWLLPRINATLA